MIHQDLQQAFLSSVRGEYQEAIDSYESLLFDIEQEDDVLLIREIVFLLKKKSNAFRTLTFETIIQLLESKGVHYVSDRKTIKKLSRRVEMIDHPEFLLMMSSSKLLVRPNFIAVNFQTGELSICYYPKNKKKYIVKYIDMDALYLLIKDQKLYSYSTGCQLCCLSNDEVPAPLASLLDEINMLFMHYHSLNPTISLIDPELIHNIYLELAKSNDIDLQNIDKIEIKDISCLKPYANTLLRYLKSVNPLMWFMTGKDGTEKYHYHDLQYTLIGEKWCEEDILLEFVAIIKAIPLFKVGKAPFLNAGSYYLPYIESYYIGHHVRRNLGADSSNYQGYFDFYQYMIEYSSKPQEDDI